MYYGLVQPELDKLTCWDILVEVNTTFLIARRQIKHFYPEWTKSIWVLDVGTRTSHPRPRAMPIASSALFPFAHTIRRACDWMMPSNEFHTHTHTQTNN